MKGSDVKVTGITLSLGMISFDSFSIFLSLMSSMSSSELEEDDRLIP